MQGGRNNDLVCLFAAAKGQRRDCDLVAVEVVEVADGVMVVVAVAVVVWAQRCARAHSHTIKETF